MLGPLLFQQAMMNKRSTAANRHDGVVIVCGVNFIAIANPCCARQSSTVVRFHALMMPGDHPCGIYGGVFTPTEARQWRLCTRCSWAWWCTGKSGGATCCRSFCKISLSSSVIMFIIANAGLFALSDHSVPVCQTRSGTS